MKTIQGTMYHVNFTTFQRLHQQYLRSILKMGLRCGNLRTVSPLFVHLEVMRASTRQEVWTKGQDKCVTREQDEKERRHIMYRFITQNTREVRDFFFQNLEGLFIHTIKVHLKMPLFFHNTLGFHLFID